MFLAVCFVSVNAYAYKVPSIISNGNGVVDVAIEYTYAYDTNETACYINRVDNRATLKIFEDVQPYVGIGLLKAQQKYLANNNSYALDTDKEFAYNAGIEFLLYKKNGYKVFCDAGYTFCNLDVDTFTINGANALSTLEKPEIKTELFNGAIGISKEFSNGMVVYSGANYIHIEERLSDDTLDEVEVFGGVIVPLYKDIKIGVNISGYDSNLSVTSGIVFNF